MSIFENPHYLTKSCRPACVFVDNFVLDDRTVNAFLYKSTLLGPRKPHLKNENDENIHYEKAM